MSEAIWVRSHVRQLLQDAWGAGAVVPDADGDVPFRCGTAACWVSVLDVEPVMVRVFAHAAYVPRESAKLLRELNEIQHRAVSARVEYEERTVLVSQTISPIGLTSPVLLQALNAVGGVAADIGGLIAAMFDGSTPYKKPAEVDETTP